MNIYEKIANVMKDVQYLSKDDSVEFKTTKYKAISEEKVTSTVRKSLIEHGLVIFPIKQVHTKDGTLTAVDVTYRIVNIEKPEEFVEVVSSGTGADTQDKGVGKAMTYAYKYMLLRTFAIPTGEDPDKISSDELDEKMEEESKKRIIAKKQVIVEICKRHRLEAEMICVSNGYDWNNMTEIQLENMIASLKQKFGDE